ncbi:hypothetical protein DRP04_05970 [Archaeoglobales archaeon]|nr:MAG: hypothetical protein DRP04_05970 [Archaeoglobales archaeon]
MRAFSIFRQKQQYKQKQQQLERCFNCKAFKPVPYAEDRGWCAYKRREVSGNGRCHKWVEDEKR